MESVKKTNGGAHSGTPRSYDHVTDAGKTLTNANIGNKNLCGQICMVNSC